MTGVDAVVFVGPSLEPQAAHDILPARMLPPVRRGDIDALLQGAVPPRAIGIVDGRFYQSLCISPKEVLRAIDRGVQVFGASSMGALRAVELAPYGMVGVGRIYEMFRSGALDADDEVAIVFDPVTLRPLCEPLVNVRIAVAAAVAEHAISPATAEAAVAAAKGLYFPHRSYRAVLDRLASELAPEEHAALATFLRERAPDAKRDDAVAMLRQMRAALESSPGGTEADRSP